MSPFSYDTPTTITCNELHNPNFEAPLPSHGPVNSPQPFLYAPTDHEEPSDLALSDDEDIAFKYDVEASSSSSETQKDPGLTARQTRFLICMHAYLGLSLVEITKAANAAFGKGEASGRRKWKRLSKPGVSAALAVARDNERLEPYWHALEEARRTLREPRGLSDEELREARGWLAKVRRVGE